MPTTSRAVRASYPQMPSRPFIATVLLLGLVHGTSFPSRAQQPTASSPAPISDLDRIRRGIDRAPSIFVVDVPADYSVRVETDEEDLHLRMAWIYDDSVVPGYVRPWYPIYHFEMQRMMIPRDFHAHLYPVGVSASGLGQAFSDAVRRRREAAARERVRAEMEALRAAAAVAPAEREPQDDDRR